MKFMKVFLVIFVIILLVIPSFSFGESTSAEPQTKTTPPTVDLPSTPSTVSIYIFSPSTLFGIKSNIKIFPVFINGLLITSLDYSEYIHYEIPATKIKIATFYLDTTNVINVSGGNSNTTIEVEPVYSSIIIKDAKFGETYYFEIINFKGDRIKIISKDEAQKRLKKYREVEY